MIKYQNNWYTQWMLRGKRNQYELITLVEELVFAFVLEIWVYVCIISLPKTFYWLYLEDKRKESEAILRFPVEWASIGEKDVMRARLRKAEESGFGHLKCDVQ